MLRREFSRNLVRRSVVVTERSYRHLSSSVTQDFKTNLKCDCTNECKADKTIATTKSVIGSAPYAGALLGAVTLCTINPVPSLVIDSIFGGVMGAIVGSIFGDGVKAVMDSRIVYMQSKCRNKH